MYCPNCELEIKGEEKSQCPICNTSLIESPFDTAAPGDDMSDTEFKLKELIRDIDEKVSKNLEESSAEQELKLDNFRLSTPEPSAREFELDLDNATPDALSESSEDQIFNLSDDQQGSGEKSREPVFDFADMGSSGNLQDVQEPLETVTEETAAPLLEPAQTIPDKTSKREIDDTVEIARFNVKPKKEDASTKDILDKALDELESDEEAVVKTRKKSFAMPVLVGSFLIALAIGAGMYILNYKSEQVTVSPVKTPKKESLVLKKTAPVAEPQQIASPVTKPLADDNTTKAGAQINVPPAPAAPAPVQPAVTQQSAPAAQQLPEVPVTIQQPAEIKMPEEKKETALKKEANLQPAPGDAKAIVSVNEPSLEKPAAAKTEPQIKKEPSAPPAASVQQEPAPPKTAIQQQEPVEQKDTPKTVPGTFTVHAGSYKTAKAASQEARRLAQKGFAAYSEKTDLGSMGIWYRIKVGSFTSRADAEKTLRQINAQERLEARIIKNN